MSIKVMQKLALVFYIHLAYFALKSLSRLMSSYMSSHVDVLGTLNRTIFNGTLKGLLISMDPHMVKDIVPLIEHLLAVILQTEESLRPLVSLCFEEIYEKKILRSWYVKFLLQVRT
jgi:hypothetical protein